MSRGLKCYFADSSQRNILGQVGRFGEELCSALLSAQIFSGRDSPLTCADLFNYEQRMAIQVKMCNWKHAQRPLPQQIQALYDEVINGFLVEHGMYAFVFYHGGELRLRKLGEGMKQASKIRSKKLSHAARAEILANELQYIYLVDIRLIRYILRRRPKLLLRKGALVYEERQKKDRYLSLYITRGFLEGFLSNRLLQADILEKAFAFGESEETKGMIIEACAYIRFNGEKEFEKSVPIFAIGRGDTVKAIWRLIRDASSLKIGESQLQLAVDS